MLEPKERARAEKILKILHQTYPDVTTALIHTNVFELSVAAILSAQQTDAGVNAVSGELFERYQNPQALAEANLDELDGMIGTISFHHAKARYLIGFGQGLVEKFGGKVPKTVEELTSLPGIGRKIAQVILGTGYGLATGIVVDTHVIRISYRLGLTENKQPLKIEKDLLPQIPQQDWIWFTHAIIWHGRAICTARLPQCSICPLNEVCPKKGVTQRK
ncbi:MAG TPA: endonuclease III [bacterium]|jgi:endonuclease-3